MTQVDNPKKAYGDLKPSIHFVPLSSIMDIAEVMKLGATKYGIKNWREQPILASTYYSAMFRHMHSWFENLEDTDPESGKHHLAHAVCCALIIMDGLAKGKLIDDRAAQEVIVRQG